VNVRRPTEADAAAVTALIAAFETHFIGEPEMRTPDLLDDWRDLDLGEDTWLVELDGRLAGYAALLTKPRVFVDAYVHPEASGRGVGTRLAELTEAEAQQRGIKLLRNGVLADDKYAHALLEARGYRIARHFYRMVIKLDSPPTAPAWPEGLRPSRFDPHQARAFHAALDEVFEDEWDHEPEPFDDWRRRRLEAPSVDLSLWFAVKDGTEIAAIAVCDRERFGMGWVGAIGVRKSWRRRGLGLALLRHCFAELEARGQKTIGLGVDAENPTGATRLYERAGMHVAWGAALFEKTLEGVSEPGSGCNRVRRPQV
jgi:mycothiol synthase